MADTNVLFEGIENKRNQCLIFLVLDTSGSMFGEKIGSVNRAIEEVLDEMQSLSDSNPYSQIEVAVLDFATTSRWVTNEPLTPENFKKSWIPLTADGMTDLGSALGELNQKLKRKSHGGWIDDSRGVCAPGIIFFTDGLPTHEYKSQLEKLKKNGWYQNAFKYCLAAGDDLEDGLEVFKELVDSKDGHEGIHLITDSNMSKLADYIKLATIAISKISSSVVSSSSDGSPAQPVSIVDQRAEVDEELNEIDNLIGD